MGQSTVNFFDINNKKRDKSGTYTTMSSSNTTGSLSNVPSETNKYTNQMALLDKELEEEGLKIERLSEQEKWNYVNSLTDTEYQRMNQYKDAGYSFGASRALLELEKQSQGGGQGGTRAEAYQTFEPIGGKNSVLNWLNLGGRLTERIDDEVQENLVEPLSFGQREKRSQALRDKYDALTEEDLKEREAKFEKEPNRRKKLYKTGTDEKTGEPIYDLTKYWQEHNKSFLDTIWGADLVDSYNIGGIEVPNISVTNMVANAPGSTLGTASATLRGVTNPLDNVAILAKLFFSEEGHEILKSRYGTFGNFVRSAEQDPIGVDSDILAVAGVGTKAGGYGAGVISGGSRIAGATERASRWSRISKNLKNLSNRLEGASDLGISVGYESVLDKTLSKLAQGNKGSNLLGDYISFSQRPLRTIREGADPSKNKNKEQTTTQQTEQVNTPANDPWDDSWITEYEEETKVTLPDTLEKPVNWTDKNGVRQAGTRKMMIESLAIEDDSVKGLPIGGEATAQGFDPDTSWRISYGGEMTTDSRGEPTRLNGRRVMISAEEGRYFDWLKKNKQNVSSSPSTSNNWTYGGIQEPVNKIVNGIKERIQVEATGLTPEVRERIRQNPYIKEYWDKTVEMINEEGAPMDNQKIKESAIEEVGNELLRRLREYEARLEDDGEAYNSLRESQVPYNFSDFMNGVYRVFSDNGITVTPEGDLSFSTTANPADMNPVNTAWYVIKSMEPNLSNMTPSQFLDFRKQLRSLINYESDSRSTRYSKKIIRQLVDGELNKLGHKEIPGLEKIDKIYHDALNELKSFKDGLVYQVGEKKGQIKDNFYSILTTINTQNRQKMKARVEKLYPDLGERVEAINMLPTLAKTYQSSPKMMKALFEKAGFLGGIRQSGGIKKAVIGWLLGIVADELFAKPLGEKRRKKAIDDLINEVSPEAMQKLANIKSKADAGIELTEQEKQDLATALQEIAIKEYEYLDEKHKKAFDEILESANNDQPKLPAPGMDTIGPDGVVRLGMGNQLNSPENPTPKTREERVQQMQQEYEVEPQTAEEMTDRYENFMDDIGGDINGEINPREVSYERFSTRTLEKLMDDDMIPRTEKDKIEEILIRRGMEAEVDDRNALDHKFAYEINKLSEREKKILGMKSKKKSEKEYLKLEEEKESLKERMGEEYNDQSKERVEEKYADLESKPLEYINEYKKSKTFKEDQAEKQVLDKLRGEWSKQPKFIREMDGNMAGKRQEIVDKPLQNGYERQTTDVGDRFINKQTGDKGAIKYNEDGTIEVVFTEESFKNSGVMDILPADAVVRFAGEPDTIKAGELRGDEYQTVGRANPDQKTITAEEGLNLKSFKGDKTIGELADEYGLKRQIVEKIFTSEGEEALGRARGDLIELVKEIKEGTAPHEVFHPIFNMVNAKRRAEIIDLVRKNKGITEGEAKEWLAESFGDYFLTGKFDTKPIPKGFVNKVKWFFNKVKEFINGTWRSRKKVQKLFDDIMEGKIERREIKNGGPEYQLKNDEIYEKAEKAKEKKLERLLTNKSYSAVALEDAMTHTYDPDFDTWLNKINTYLEEKRNASIRSMLNRRELVDAYSIMQEYGSDGVMDFYKTAERVNSEDGNKRMSDTYELLKKMKEDPLKIPDDIKYEPQTYELRQTLYDIETPLNYLVESYDPDPLEWINEIRKTHHVLIREIPKYEELVKIQNLLDKFIESGGKKIEGTFNDKMINKLVEKRINKNSILGSTFDEKAIREIGGDIEGTLQNRTSDFINYRYRTNGRGTNMPDEAVGDFVYALGNSYDPNIDIWKENMEKELKKMFPNYNPDEKPLIWEHQYQTLKSRIEQLGKYDNTDYQMLREDDMSGIFMEGVNNKKAQQIADKSEKATQDLVAVSGLSISNFERQMKGLEGKSPMPSIGITDPNVPHENRGELTLVFGKDTVDPKVNPENVIYGSDAYTPMFPSTRTKGGLDLDDMHRIANQINDKYLGSDVGVRELIIDRIKDLKDLDIEDNEAWESEYIRFQARFEQQVNSILEERMDEGVEPIELEDKEIHEIWEDIITPILENQPKTVIEGSNFKDSQKRFNEDTVRWYVHQLDVKGLIPEDTMQNLGGEDAIVFDIIETGTEDGVDGILNVFENYNIEPGDPQSREIAQAIYNSAKPQDRPYTAENALEAMKQSPESNRSTRPGSFRDMIGAEGTKIRLEDVRNKNFGKMVHDEYLGNIGYLEDRYDQIVSIIGDEYMGGYPDDGLFHHGEHDEEVREMIKDAYDTDIEKFKDNLRDISKPDGTVEKLKLPDEMLQRIVDLVEQGKKVPIRFSESKPQRVVDLYEEVKYVLVPDKDVERVNKMVEGTPLEGKVEGYKPDDYSAPRSKKIKELQKKYGNIFFSFGGAVMPIAMLLMMIQGEDEGEGQQA